MTGTTARIRKPRLSKPQISIPQGTKRIALAVVAVLIVALFAGAVNPGRSYTPGIDTPTLLNCNVAATPDRRHLLDASAAAVCSGV